MLMPLFVLFVSLSLIFIILDVITGVALFGIIGTIMLFILGGIMLDDGVEYKVGSNVTQTINGSSTHIDTVDVYETYNNSNSNRFGWFLMILGALSFVLILYEGL